VILGLVGAVLGTVAFLRKDDTFTRHTHPHRWRARSARHPSRRRHPGAFQLSDGTIEIETTAHDEPGGATATAALIGGTGAYEGAVGSVDVTFEKNTYTLHLLIPN